MRLVTVFAALVLQLPLAAQTSTNERTTLETLLGEVQQLRRAIERSTVVNARTQLAVQRIQMQEARVGRLSQTLDTLRSELMEMHARQPQVAARIKELEEQALQIADSAARKQAEFEIRDLKGQQEGLAAAEQQKRTREADAAAQLQIEQGRLTELYDRAAQIERDLDASMRQLTTQH